MAYLRCPNLNIQNARFRLQLHRENEARFPLSIRSFERRPSPRISRGYFILSVFVLFLLALLAFSFLFFP